ncbi:MAG TPA: hypothetical protein PK018_09740 [Candidatus Competibacter sp.]|nr:hypothetical protein [Candidatus Competibacter sp.]
MHLSDHSLRQMDDADVQSLDVEALRGLSVRLLADLKDARDRLNQGPDNSSRPPSGRAPWDRPGDGELKSDAADAVDSDSVSASADTKPVPTESPSTEAKPVRVPVTRKPGKPLGAPGIGRTQVFQTHAEQPHHPNACAGCGRPLDQADTVAYTGFQSVDLCWSNPA